MPSKEEHFNQAQCNQEFLKSFYNKDTNNDWAITVAFYTVLHVIEGAIFIDQPFSVQHSDDISLLPHTGHHEKRNYVVKEIYKEIVNPYMLLYRESRNSRYKKFAWTKFETGLIVVPSLTEIFEWANKKYKISLNSKL